MKLLPKTLSIVPHSVYCLKIAMIQKNIRHLGLLVFSFVFCIFNLHNILVYDPFWGYDAPGHIRVAQYILEHHSLPVVGTYAASNPPFYYIWSAMILGLTGSIKMVQLSSFLFFTLGIGCFYQLLKIMKIAPSRSLVWTVFFSFLAVGLEYCYMVFNYGMGYAFSIFAIAIMASLFLKKPGPNTKWAIIGIGILIGLGMLTSLTNCAIIIACACGIFLLPDLKLTKRLAYFSILILTVGAMVFPYYKYKMQQYDCFFCTKNRIESKRALTEAYDPYFYYGFPATGFDKPYYPNDRFTLWLTLHETFYGDYFEYLIGPSYANTTAPAVGRDLPLTLVGQHFIGPNRIAEMRILNILGLGISGFLILALGQSLLRSWKFFRGTDADGALDCFLLLSMAGVFAQFLVYIHRYPNGVNVHSGYLYPAVFCWLILAARNLKKPGLFAPCAVFCSAYSLMSFWTFWLH